MEFEQALRDPFDRRPKPRPPRCILYNASAARLLVASTEKAAAELSRKKKLSAVKEGMLRKARSWAACLARIFEIYPLICPNCRIELKPVAVILDDKELVRRLSHLGLPDELPKMKPAPKTCGPPDEDCQLCPGADLYDDISPPSPED
jgi:hypothetical protein